MISFCIGAFLGMFAGVMLCGLLASAAREPAAPRTGTLAQRSMHLWYYGLHLRDQQEAAAEEMVDLHGQRESEIGAELCREAIYCHRHPADMMARINELGIRQ